MTISGRKNHSISTKTKKKTKRKEREPSSLTDEELGRKGK